jgi:hypothetical protein
MSPESPASADRFFNTEPPGGPSSTRSEIVIHISASLTMLKPFTMCITTNCKKFLRDGNIRLPYCLLRNMFAGQEATVRTRHGTMDWFKIGKGEQQGCILSSCLSNFYAEYIM